MYPASSANFKIIEQPEAWVPTFYINIATVLDDLGCYSSVDTRLYLHQPVTIIPNNRPVFADVLLWEGSGVYTSSRSNHSQFIQDVIEKFTKQFITQWNLNNKPDASGENGQPDAQLDNDSGTFKGTTTPVKPVADEIPAPEAAPTPVTEQVIVKYRGPVNLASFACEAVNRSIFIRRVCYDAKNAYMLIDLNGTYYHYCEIDEATLTGLLTAPSMGRFFNASIKRSFDCRTHRVPAYYSRHS
jgi:hypothetical protein